MRKIVLTTAAIAMVGLSAPAFADMTLPAGAYSQAAASDSIEARGPAFNALVDQDHVYLGRSASGAGSRAHHVRQR